MMKLNEMLSGDIGNLIFVLQILSAKILDEFLFSSHSVNLFQRCVVFLMTVIFSPFLNKVRVTSAKSGDEYMAVNAFGANRSQLK